ncbi:hypothetical protein [Kutzneria buriramensis]|uniref:Uncharacterized protein n=1 Tax=Kutzneria buriramensis TaxID=1045776 RepID=A0A3E0GU42_9PSEU|nr:hypothetical protein [Kutzneria buriramensis]REH26961.1 hypothetical protein BCF44_13116 [Kutzneria buriramensis]
MGSAATIETRVSEALDKVVSRNVGTPSAADSPQFIGHIAHVVEQAFAAYGAANYGPGVITSKAVVAAAGDGVTARSSVLDLLSVRERSV